jgi:mannose-6-phosphate isomerase
MLLRRPQTFCTETPRENVMALEHLSPRAVPKPWGSSDLRPWGEIPRDGEPVGELWFERLGETRESALLLKLLYTTQPLSIQVHPDDQYARSIGLAHGKTEAWYVLSATPDARVGVGLKWALTTSQYRKAIEDGSIADLVQWRHVQRDDVILVPAGTIHAIGPGLVIVEIQQRSDTTFRIFDYGRKRELQIDKAVAAADPSPATGQPVARKLTDARRLLVADPHFVLEQWSLPPRSVWDLAADGETWIYAMRGNAQIGPFDVAAAGAIFVENDHARIEVGENGFHALASYVGGDIRQHLLSSLPVSEASAPGAGMRSATLQ